MNISERIKLIAENEGIKLTQLEDKLGASKGVLTKSYNKGTDIQLKWLSLLVENYPQYDAKWLLTGKGKMLSVSTPSMNEIGHNESSLTLLLKRVEELAIENSKLKNELEKFKTQKNYQKSDSLSIASEP